MAKYTYFSLCNHLKEKEPIFFKNDKIKRKYQ